MAGPANSDSGKVETSAISLLTRAVELDKQRRFQEATVYYQEGLQQLLDVIKSTTEEPKKSLLREKALQYMDRAEKIKEHCDKVGASHDKICIANNSTGNSYHKIFGPYLDDKVTAIIVEDPYVRQTHQVYNFLRFCELAVKQCKNLKRIKLTTTFDDRAYIGPTGFARTDGGHHQG